MRNARCPARPREILPLGRTASCARSRASRSRIASVLLLTLVLALRSASAAAQPDGTVVTRDTVRFSADARERFGRFVSARIGDEDARGVFDRVVVERVLYLSDGLRIAGYLATPQADSAGAARLPAVIYNRGGTGEFGALDSVAVAAVLVPLAARGYAVAASQYRGTSGSEGHDEYGGADVADVLALLPLLDAHPRVDPDRIGMIGMSRGGLMTYLALVQTDRICAAVVQGGLSDARALVAARPEMESEVLSDLVPGWVGARDAALDARSPVRWAERIARDTPLLLLHGAADDRVAPQTALAMAGALLTAGRPVRLVLYEGAGHGLSPFRGEAFAETVRWLDRYVRSTP